MSSLLHQVVHGYRDGHQMLASSLQLTNDSLHTLLLLSDNSGILPDPKFDGYLTGYPLASDEFYVLSRTWSAPEMSRPGCVWTHSLLIPRALILERQETDVFAHLHRRPTMATLNEYSEPLLVKNFPATPDAWVSESKELSTLMHRFYLAKKLPITFWAESTSSAEKCVLAMWAQGWPRLRFSFSFCTAVARERTRDGKPLAVQCQVDHEDTELKEMGDRPKWVGEILKAEASSWNNFLATYASNLAARPNLMPILSEIYTAWKGSVPSSDTFDISRRALEVVDRRAHGDDLRYLLAERIWNDVGLDGRTLGLLLSECAIDERHACHRAVSKFAAIADRLPEKGIAFVRQAYDQHLVCKELLLRKWVERWESADMPSSVNRAILVDLISLQPEVLTRPASWRELDQEHPSPIAEAISMAPDSMLAPISTALMRSGAYVLGTKVIQLVGPRLSASLLEALVVERQNVTDHVVDSWLSALEAGDPESFGVWLVSSPDQVLRMDRRIVANHMAYYESQIGSFLPNVSAGYDDLLDAAVVVCCFESKNLVEFFNAAQPYWDQLYLKAAAGRLSSHAFSLIDRYLPRVAHEDRWDVCERLRQWLLYCARSYCASSKGKWLPSQAGSVLIQIKRTYLRLRQQRKIDDVLDTVLLTHEERTAVSVKRRKRKFSF